MLQIPTRIKPAYNAENIFALNKTTSHPDSFFQNPAPHHPLDAPVSQSVSPAASVPEKHKTPVLRTIIQKGQKVRIGMVGQLPRIRVALGWNVSNVQCDIDLSAYLLDASGKVPGDDWFVFYGQTLSPDGSVALYVNGNKVGEQTGEHVFTFKVPLNGELHIQAVAGDRTDESVIRHVDTPNPEYKLHKTKSKSANWV